jgi:hypothetical protein
MVKWTGEENVPDGKVHAPGFLPGESGFTETASNFLSIGALICAAAATAANKAISTRDDICLPPRCPILPDFGSVRQRFLGAGFPFELSRP